MTAKKKPEELNNVEYIITFVDRTERCIKILDRILPNIDTKYEEELKHIRDELAQVTQMGVLIKERHGKSKDKTDKASTFYM